MDLEQVFISCRRGLLWVGSRNFSCRAIITNSLMSQFLQSTVVSTSNPGRDKQASLLSFFATRVFSIFFFFLVCLLLDIHPLKGPDLCRERWAWAWIPSPFHIGPGPCFLTFCGFLNPSLFVTENMWSASLLAGVRCVWCSVPFLFVIKGLDFLFSEFICAFKRMFILSVTSSNCCQIAKIGCQNITNLLGWN